MLNVLGRWLKIYEDEIGLFMWTMTLLFLIRSSGIVFNNFAETAFLKRFGVEYLPIVYMINSITTFIIMGVLAGIMASLPSARLLSYLLVFCGVSVAGLRFLIPFGFDLMYPLLFVLKAQYEILLGLIFWNLANDLFNTRQSKRLFPLIMAGGVLGEIIGSFGTPVLVKILSIDNLLLAYLTTTMLGAVAVKSMGSRFPTILISEKEPSSGRTSKSRSGIIGEFKKIIPMMKESMLIKIMVLLTFLPNLVIPIMNYQFNFAIDEQFATEGGMIAFFSYFRGFMNIISLFLLLFVGRIYGRWGLPVALMFHPFNYVLAFMAFLLRFDIFAAMYARLSTNVLRTVFNKPAGAILMGLFPVSYRVVVRPFLRGTVVRIGLLLSSGIILISAKFFHPRYLSLVAIPLVFAWVVTTFWLKKSYSKILLDLISRNILDLKSMEEEDVGHLFTDKTIRGQLVQSFLEAEGEDVLWYARFLKSISVEDLDTHILTGHRDLDDKTQIELLGFLSPQAGEAAVEAVKQLVDPEKPDLTVAVIQTVNRLAPESSPDFNQEVFETSRHPEVQAYAVAGLLSREPQKYRAVIDSWLDSQDLSERKAGVIAAGESKEDYYVSRLGEILKAETNDSIIEAAVKAIHRLGPPEVNAIVYPYLSHSLESVRLAGLEAYEINDDGTLKRIIEMIADSSDQVHRLAKTKIEAADYHNGRLLVESLNIPHRRVREGLFELLDSLNIKDLDVFRFARTQIEDSYICLAGSEGIKLLPENPGRNLLIDHLDQKRRVLLENVLRVLAAQDRSGQMRIICRGIFSSDSRQRANSQEALDDIMDIALSKILMPLLGDSPPSQTLAAGRKYFPLPELGADEKAPYAYFLTQDDWITVILTLHMAQGNNLEDTDRGIIRELTRSVNAHIRRMAQRVIDQQKDHSGIKEDGMPTEISITDKILHLKGIDIFKGLSVSELAAIASVTEEIVYPPSEIVIKEGDTGETMYLIVYGEVSVIKGYGLEQEIELDRTGGGDYFGEMALFEDVVRSATIRTEQESRLLVLHKQEFKEIVREYPQIALELCKVLSGRLRRLHEKVTGRET